MKTNLISLIIALLIAGCDFREIKKPKIWLSETNISFDTVKATNKKSKILTIKNTGNDTLTIVSFDCSCECTVPDLRNGTNINPFDSLLIKLSVNGYKDDIGKWKSVLCTFKTNSDSIFKRVNIRYYTYN